MRQSERYAFGRSRIRVYNELVYASRCNRLRCMEVLVHQQQTPEASQEDNEQRTFRYPAHAVVVSVNDGERKFVYCSIHCMSLDLKSRERKGELHG